MGAEAPLPGPAPAPGTNARLSKKRQKIAAEAERLLNMRTDPAKPGKRGAPPRLAEFYHALVDAFPGYNAQLAKLLIEKWQLSGMACPSDSERSSSASSEKKKKKKKKEKKKEKKKRKKERLKEAEANSSSDES